MFFLIMLYIFGIKKLIYIDGYLFNII